MAFSPLGEAPWDEAFAEALWVTSWRAGALKLRIVFFLWDHFWYKRDPMSKAPWLMSRKSPTHCITSCTLQPLFPLTVSAQLASLRPAFYAFPLRKTWYLVLFMALFHRGVRFGPSTSQPSSEGCAVAQLSYGPRFHRRSRYVSIVTS
jgi:hypothetical protein